MRNGPVCFASAWHVGMDSDGPDAVLEPVGRVRGWHAYLFTRFSLKRRAVWTPNSWGGAGQGWITLDSVQRLLDGDGDAAIPTNRRLQPTT